jgi:hypothetical protein
VNLLWIIPVAVLASWVIFNTAGWLSMKIWPGESGVRYPFSWRIYVLGPWYVDYCWDRRP